MTTHECHPYAPGVSGYPLNERQPRIMDSIETETSDTPLATEPAESTAETTPEPTATATPAEVTPEPSTEAPAPPEAATTTPEPTPEPVAAVVAPQPEPPVTPTPEPAQQATELASEPPVTPPVPSQPATVGRIVLYRLKYGPYYGQERPAIVVRVWNDNMVNLQVFTDGPNDGEPYQAGVYWATSVHEDERETPEPGTWRWPPRG